MQSHFSNFGLMTISQPFHQTLFDPVIVIADAMAPCPVIVIAELLDPVLSLRACEAISTIAYKER